MGCCNEPVSTLSGAAPDPSQHVNYARGMVLGVDDFTQEFAYLAERDQWLARDAIGYGTLSGLRVTGENDGTDGPRLHVSAGSALVPSGKHVCVPADQCAVINRWLAKPDNAAIVNRLLNPSSPPLSPPASPPADTEGTISLFLTLCYADCKTRPVPIPGEPCRSDDELMAPSRIADDFRLELREFAPVQTEEDAVRDFVRWLRVNVNVVDVSPPPAGDEAAWLAELNVAADAWLDAQVASPALSPPASFESLGDYLVDLAIPIDVGHDSLCDFLRVAIRFWVTVLRPLWMAMRCHAAQQRDIDCLLLARVSFDVQWIGGSPTGSWQITGSPPDIQIDESTRPILAHLRLLQEWMLCGCDCGAGAAMAAAPQGGDDGPVFARRPPLVPLALRPPEPVAGPSPIAPLRVPLVNVSASLTLDESHSYVIARDGTSVAITLPPSIPANEGRVYVIKNVNVRSLSIRADAGAKDMLDDLPSISVARGRAATVVADGAGRWYEMSDTVNARARRPI